MSTNAELLKYTQSQDLKVIKMEYTMWEEENFTHCDYVFKLLYNEGLWIAENFSNDTLPRLPSSMKDLQDFWKRANDEIERMKGLEYKMKGDQLLMQTKILADLSALLLQKKLDRDLLNVS